MSLHVFNILSAAKFKPVSVVSFVSAGEPLPFCRVADGSLSNPRSYVVRFNHSCTAHVATVSSVSRWSLHAGEYRASFAATTA